MSKYVLALVLVLAGTGVVSYVTSNDSKTTSVTTTMTEVEKERFATNATGQLTVKATTLEVGDDVVRFDGEVTQKSVALTINALEDIRTKGAKKAYLLINSPGGEVFSGSRLTNYIKSSPIPIYTICNGMCASMAAHIHQVGYKRLMTPKSILMFHPASGGAQGTVEQMTNRIKILKQFVDGLDMDIAKRSGIDYKEFKAELATELWIETPEALSRHFADGVVNILGKEPIPQGGLFERNSFDYFNIELH